MNKKLLFLLPTSLLLGVTSCEISDFISDTFSDEEKKLLEEVADAKRRILTDTHLWRLTMS